MAGFVGGFLNGLGAVNNMMDDAQQRQARQITIDRAKRQQADDSARRDELSSAMTPTAATDTNPSSASYENSMDLGGQPPRQAKQPLMHEALSSAAQKLAQRGDLEGADKYMKQAAAYKTLWAEGRISDAWRQGPEALVNVANQLSPGANFSVAQGQDGTLTVSGMGVGGQPMTQTFRNRGELGAWAAQIANPGNLYTAFHEQEKLAADIALKRAQAAQSTASADNLSANAEDTRATLQPKIGLMGAQRDSAVANSVQSYAGANAANASADRQRAEARQIGIGPVRKTYQDLVDMGFSEDEARQMASGAANKGKAREQAILDVATKMGAADAQQLGTKPRSQQELLRDATAMVDGAASAAGTARVGTGPAQRGAASSAAGATPAGMRPEERQRAEQIRADVRAGRMTREDAIRELQAIGFQ